LPGFYIFTLDRSAWWTENASETNTVMDTEIKQEEKGTYIHYNVDRVHTQKERKVKRYINLYKERKIEINRDTNV
jgi:Holliday junction resolvase-like predicted endonuclease